MTAALVTLILFICDDRACHSERVPAELTAMQCMLAGQQVAATWPMAPGERIGGWRCAAGERA
jgi:hypothetical protein